MQKAKRLTILFILWVIFIWLLPLNSSAISTEFGDVNNIGEYLTRIFAWLTPIIITLAVLMTIYAGYLYMTSQGNPESVNRAKDIIIGVVIGLMLYFLMTLIRSTIGV
jgi:ABC-type polysaccharide/polyol phosphate export permease